MSAPTPENMQLTFASAIIRRKNEFLIVRPHGQGERTRWAFPTGAVAPEESPEAACRRVCSDGLGLQVVIDVGQPPLQEQVGDRTVIHRYFFCHIESGEMLNRSFAEARWVHLRQLPDYEYDPVTQIVMEWLQKNF